MVTIVVTFFVVIAVLVIAVLVFVLGIVIVIAITVLALFLLRFLGSILSEQDWRSWAKHKHRQRCKQRDAA